MSFKNKRNRIGPKVDPCGTPCTSGNREDIYFAKFDLSLPILD